MDGKGKITVPWKWREEEGEEEIDLDDPNVIDKLTKKWNQSHGYEKGQTELNAVKGDLAKANNDITIWNNLIEDAERTGNNEKVIAALKMSGVKFDDTKEEIILDEGNKEVKVLEEKLSSLEKKLTDSEQRQYNTFVSDAHTQLEAKYNDGKYPEYNRSDVEDFANKKGIRDFEDAYKILKHEELMKTEINDDKDKNKKHAAKVKKVAVKEPGSGSLPAKPVPRHSDYGKATEEWLENKEITDNIFNEE